MFKTKKDGFKMEEIILRQSDMATEPGGKQRASEIPNNKRMLTVEIIRE